MSLSSMFRRPLLIYDDKCYSCAMFAKASSALSRGWIRIAGHYYSQDAKEAKEMIFPPGYDATKMFWLVNGTGAYGARSGLPQVMREIVVGLCKGSKTGRGGDGDGDGMTVACEYDSKSMSCYTPSNVFKRLIKMLSHGAKFTFPE
ncbi:MAG TPA: hypothetical protein VF172_04160 [Nitrososphaera sp.]